MGVVLAQVQRREKPLSHVKVGLHDTALEAPSLLEGAGLEIGQECHPPFVFLLLWSRGSRHAGLSGCKSWALEAGPVAVAHGLSCPTVYGIFQDQGSNQCPLH